MNRILGRWLLAALLLSPLGALADANDAVEKEIRGLEQAFNAAYLANDLKKYFAYYADDLVAIFPEGRNDKKSYLKMWTEFLGKGNRLTGNTITDLSVRVSPLGDEATASYAVAVQTHLADGKVTNENFFETDIWLKRAGQWQVAHVHYSQAELAQKPSWTPPPAKKP